MKYKMQRLCIFREVKLFEYVNDINFHFWNLQKVISTCTSIYKKIYPLKKNDNIRRAK